MYLIFCFNNNKKTFENRNRPAWEPARNRRGRSEQEGTWYRGIIMRYWYDYSEIEIAESLRLTVSAVKSRLHRARKELAGMWQEEETHAETERRPYETPAF